MSFFAAVATSKGVGLIVVVPVAIFGFFMVCLINSVIVGVICLIDMRNHMIDGSATEAPISTDQETTTNDNKSTGSQ